MKRTTSQFTRRQIIAGGAAALAAAAQSPASGRTNFQLACMTLAYSGFPFERALEGIKSAGYDYVAWGTSHRENPQAERVDLIAVDAPASRAKQLGQQCRDAGLDPVMMFSRVYVAAENSVPAHTKRIEQAAAAGIPFLLTFGHV